MLPTALKKKLQNRPAKRSISLWWLLLPCVLLIASSLVWYGWDEDLRPEVSAALAWEPPPNAFGDNGHLIEWGINAPLDADPSAYGRLQLEKELERYSFRLKTGMRPPAEAEVKTDASRLMQRLDDRLCGYTEHASCSDFYVRQGADKLAEMLEEAQPLTERYTAIWKAKEYVEAIPPYWAAGLPDYRRVAQGSELERVRAVLLVAGGRGEEALDVLAANAARSRQWFKRSGSLNSYLYALNQIHRDTRILSEQLEAHPSLANQLNSKHGALLEPIDGELSGLVGIISHEQKSILDLIRNLPRTNFEDTTPPEESPIKEAVGSLLYLRYGTLNRMYDATSELRDVALTPANALDAAKSHYKARWKSITWTDASFYSEKNVAGRLMIQVSDPDFPRYRERQIDVDTYVRMVALQASNLQAQTWHLEPHRLMNPYTGEELPFDPSTGELSFEGRHPSPSNFEKSQRYRVRLSGDGGTVQ